MIEQQSSEPYAGFLLDDLQDPLGRKEEVNEAAKAVSAVLPLHHTEKLPQDGGSGGTEGAVQGRQGALDAVVQRLGVLNTQVVVTTPGLGSGVHFAQ